MTKNFIVGRYFEIFSKTIFSSMNSSAMDLSGEKEARELFTEEKEGVRTPVETLFERAEHLSMDSLFGKVAVLETSDNYRTLLGHCPQVVLIVYEISYFLIHFP